MMNDLGPRHYGAPGASLRGAFNLIAVAASSVNPVAQAGAGQPRTARGHQSAAPSASPATRVDSRFGVAFVHVGDREGRKIRQTDRNARFLISNFDSRGPLLPLIAAAPPNMKPGRFGDGLFAFRAPATITLAPHAAQPGVWGKPQGILAIRSGWQWGRKNHGVQRHPVAR